MTCGERAIVMPEANSAVALSRSNVRGMLGGLHHDVLVDVFNAHLKRADRTNRTDCLVLDAIHAEFSRRHAPA